MFVRIHNVFGAWTLKYGTVLNRKWTLRILLKDKQFLASTKTKHGMALLVSNFDEKKWFTKYYFAILVSSFYNLLQKCSRIYILGMLHRKEIDIAPQGFSVSKGRASVVDFLPGIAPNYVQLFIRTRQLCTIGLRIWNLWDGHVGLPFWHSWSLLLRLLQLFLFVVEILAIAKNFDNVILLKTNRIIETKIER